MTTNGTPEPDAGERLQLKDCIELLEAQYALVNDGARLVNAGEERVNQLQARVEELEVYNKILREAIEAFILATTLDDDFAMVAAVTKGRATLAAAGESGVADE